MAGTSGRRLPKTLGIKQGHSVVLLNAPAAFGRSLETATDGVRVSDQLRFSPVDVVVFFVDRIEELERRFVDIAERLHPAGGLWVAWRNRASRRITHDVVRRIGLAAGMVDNKACAIDGVWSGMRLVVRSANRDAIAYRASAPPAPKRTRRATTPPRLTSGGSVQTRARARRLR